MRLIRRTHESGQKPGRPFERRLSCRVTNPAAHAHTDCLAGVLGSNRSRSPTAAKHHGDCRGCGTSLPPATAVPALAAF